MMSTPSGPGGGFVNLRDVGGLPLIAGGRTVSGRLFRSEAPLPGDERPGVRPWPPRTVVDLRSPGEAAEAEHPLASAATQVVHLPLTRELDPARMAEHQRPPAADLPTIYGVVIRRLGTRLAEVVDLVASSPGPVLVHCAAGKDRTGIAIAVTLAAGGVEPRAIVADYVRTEQRADALPDRVARGWSQHARDAWSRRSAEERLELMRAPAVAIEGVLGALTAWPGGTSRWLLDHGLDRERQEALRRRLTDPAA